MNSLLPFLAVRGPEGQEFQVEIEKDRITIGRFSEFNDIALEPDPQQLVTRKVHCAIELDCNGWWVVDNGSVNKAFVQRGQIVEIVNGRAPLTDGDIIRILGKLTDQGDAIYWELTFRDPLKTQPAQRGSSEACLEYDWIQARLFRVDGSNREEISGLRPQEHKLIRYMDQRNRANSNVPVMCTYEEIVTNIWGDEIFEKALKTELDVNHLVWELRQKLETNPKEPRFLQTVRGLGYRLVSRLLSK